MDSYASQSHPDHPGDQDWPQASLEPETVQRNRLLAKAVEYEILPRLMLAHRFVQEGAAPTPTDGQTISPTEVFEFSRLVMDGDDASLHEAVAAVRRRGVSQQSVLLNLLAPTAQHLGELWVRDLCDFNDVTVALGRLQQILREHSAAPPPTATPRGTPSRSILLAPCPGEQHTFGLSVVAEFFHQARWEVSAGHMSADVDPAQMVSQQWFDVVGLSLGGSTHLNTLIQCIADIRRFSVYTRIFIILGGPIFALHPEYAAQLDADAVITDGSAAPALAEQLLARVASQV